MGEWCFSMEPAQQHEGHYTAANRDYDHSGKWALYWEQIATVRNLLPEGSSVLVIGPGIGVVPWYLTQCGYDVETLDCDTIVDPTYVGDIRSVKLHKKFDIVLCCHVLEHIPRKDVLLALLCMREFTKQYAIISIPHVRLFFEAAVHIHGYYVYPRLMFPVSVLKHKFDGMHYWELGKRGFSASDLRIDMQKAGFEIQREWYPPLNGWSHYFQLKPESLGWTQ